MNNFYVYEWFIKDTGHIFHVGKGKGNRWKDLDGRNIYFTRIVNKYDVDSRIYKDNLSEQEAWDLERKRIEELWLTGQCETNIHEGGEGGDTVTHMPKEMYEDFCRKVGDKTLERCEDPAYREKLKKSISEAMAKPEVRKKVSDRTKKAMEKEDVRERLWENGLANPVMIVFNDNSYKVYKFIGEYKLFLKDTYELGGRWFYRLFTEPFKVSYITKNNKNINDLIGAKAYKIDKKLFKSVTTMADECKSVGEILSLLQAHNSRDTEEIV